MRGPSDRCSIVPGALLPPSLAFVVLLSAATSPPYRVTAEPRTPEEQALRDALSRTDAGPPAAAAEALRKVSGAYPGTPASGLAQLAAGLALAGGQKEPGSMPLLTPSDVE